MRSRVFQSTLYRGCLAFALSVLFSHSGSHCAAQVPPESDDRIDPGYDLGVAVPMDEGDRTSIFGSNGKYGVKKGASVVFPAVYDKIDFLGQELLLVKKGNSMGVANYSGKMLVPISYDSVAHFYSGNAVLLLKNGKWGSIAMDGETILPLKYDTILYSNSQNRISYAVQKGERMFLYGDKRMGKAISSLGIYGNAVVAKREGKFGILQENRATVPFEYDSIYVQSRMGNNQRGATDFVDHKTTSTAFVARRNGKYGLLKADGSVLFAANNDKITHDPLRHIFILQKDSLQGLYLENSGKKTPLEYSSVYTDGVQYINLRKKGKHGMIDYAANTVLPFEYDKIEITGFNAGFRVKKNGKMGWIKANGEVIVPVVYDDLETFNSFESQFNGLYKVQTDKRYGVINSAGKVIVPARFKNVWTVGDFLIADNDDSSALYSVDGREIVRPEYRWFKKSVTQGSGLIYAFKDSLRGIIDGKGTVLYGPVIKKAGYITNEDGLLNPFTTNGRRFQYLKDKNNKYGVLDEISGKTVVPLMYDDIFQKFEADSATFFAAKKGTKFGLISSGNRVVIPFDYDSIDLSLAGSSDDNTAPQFVVRKGKLFGALTADNQVAIPLEYTALMKLSGDNLYKARKANTVCMLINGKNELVVKALFDDIAQFEGDRALSFYDGMMRVIDKKGKYLTQPTPMQMHDGYRTFEEMKWALIDALNNSDNTALKEVARKMAPSEHMLYFLKTNMFNREPIGELDIEDVRAKYYATLLRFKQSYWNSSFYRKESLTSVEDYTRYEDGYVTNSRTTDHAFGDSKYMEKILRNAIKINGYWISSYFLGRSFSSRYD